MKNNVLIIQSSSWKIVSDMGLRLQSFEAIFPTSNEVGEKNCSLECAGNFF